VKLQVPAGVTQVILDDGRALAPDSNGQIDVQPHMVKPLTDAGYTVVGPDALVSDAPVPPPETVFAES